MKNYFDRYQEIYNEIDGNFEDVTVRTFKVGLPTHSDLWKSLTMKPPKGMIVKSKEESKHLSDLGKIFAILRQHKLRLNASKCSFGVGSSGYMITHRGIEVNPDQIKAIHDLHPPRNPKEVQRLTGMTVRTYVFHLLRTYVILLCNWLIL